MQIGWIGLGQIGTQMVLRLRGAGFPVLAYSRGDGRAEAANAGAELLPDYRALAERSEIVIVCVYDEAQMQTVLFEQGTLEAMRPGTLLVIHTTASPAALKRIAEAGEKQGVDVLDACFSGGPADVAAGRLTLMTGGSAQALERARPVLTTYAATIDHVGEVGQGQLVKLLNNLLFATNLMNAAELLALAETHDLAPQDIASIIQRSSGSSFSMDIFRRSGGSRDEVMAGIRPYLEKDVANAIAAATSAGIDVTRFAAVARYYEAPPRQTA